MSRIDIENAKILRHALDVNVTIDDLIFTNENIISCNVVLRGTKRELDKGSFTLEGSEIELKARVEGNSDTWIGFVSELDEGAEITYSSGYDGDMSADRTFYLQDADYDVKTCVLTIKGCDATIYKLEADFSGRFIESTYADVRQDYYDAIKDILDDCDIDYQEAGSVPQGTGTTATNIYFEKGNCRQIVALASGLYKDGNEFAISYRDAGRPQLIAGESVTFWELDEADLCDFYATIERNVKEYDCTLPTYYVGSEEELATAQDCTAGSVYFVDMQDPVYSIGTCTNCTAQKLGLYAIKFTCTTSGECVVNGRKIKESTLLTDAPRHIIDEEHNGTIVDLGTIQKLMSDNGSLTYGAIEDMLEEPIEKYTFKWRGNPHIQPSDILRVNRYSAGRLKPRLDLYPSNDLIPDGESYIDLRVQSVTLEHSGGGLISTIEARKFKYYDTWWVQYPSNNLYPSTELYPA